MLVRNQTTEAVVTDGDFRREFPNTSFPPQLSPELLSDFGYDRVMEGAQPSGEPWQSAQRDGVEQINGQWFTKYVLTPTFETQEEHDAYGATWAATQLKAQTPEKISDRQFFTALWKDNERIAYEEALAAVATGTIPAEMAGFLAMLATYDPVGAQDAELLLSGATEFRRDTYLAPVFGSMYGMSEVEIDALWRLGATL